MAGVAETADKLYEWALSLGLVQDDAIYTSGTPHIVTDDLFPETSSSLLRKFLIQHIAINEPANEIIVFTKRAIPASKKVRDLLPQSIEGVQLVYRQGKIQQIGSAVAHPHSSPPWTLRQHANGSGVYACGSSISVGNNRDAGTFGALVRDESGSLYGLSNNHVTGACNYASTGLPIVAPGVFDVAPGSIPPFTIGFHERSLQMTHGFPGQIDPTMNLDAAIFRINNPALVTSWQGNCYDTPPSTGTLEASAIVEKVGRTTGATTGKVIGRMRGATAICYHAPLYQFSGNVYFDPLFVISGHGDMFSDSGDSGSLIVRKTLDGSRIAVGIVVGGFEDSSAPGGKLTLALPIEPILKNLGVTLVSGHNG